jgi:GNAT superfamily N-acetyltransferase
LITHFLGEEEVKGYVRDLAERLQALGADAPLVWCPIGNSGDKLLRVLGAALGELNPQLAAQVRVVELVFDKSSRTIQVGQDSAAADLKGQRVLLIDSSVHTGSSMFAAARFAQSQGAVNVVAYTLVLKKSASFLPHLFGLVVGDHDRVLFQLDKLPNNRLFANRTPYGLFRRLVADDAARTQCLDTGVPSLDKISFGDLYYECAAKGYDVVIAEDGDAIAGFLKMKVDGGRRLFIDVIANDQKYRGKGLGGALMRYAETTGRASCCTHIDLWAIEDQVEFYQKLGYAHSGEVIDAGGGELYRKMSKPLIYSFTDESGHRH